MRAGWFFGVVCVCNVSGTAWQARGFAALRLLVFAIALSLSSVLSRPAAAQALKGEVTAAIENGYARLAFQFDEQIETQVRIANNILTISFPRPVDISVDRIAASAAGYVSAARRDPDGKAYASRSRAR